LSGDAKAAKAASVRAKLLTLSTSTGITFDLLAQRYAVERLLVRLQRSPHEQTFILKGAMVFLTWGVTLPRPTRDLDLMGFVAPETEELARIFREIISVPVEEDGLAFLPETVVADQIREEDLYAGVRVKMRVMLGSMRIALQIDVGTGDSLIPEPIAATFPALLGGEAPVLRSYSRELVVVEKFEAIVKLGEQNSRMKDFFDVWFLATKFDLDADLLRDAITNTFRRRGTSLPKDRPLPLTEVFTTNPAKQVQWKAFVSKSGLDSMAPSLEQAVDTIWALVRPVLR
jgi:hypothetical protein